MRQPWAWAIAVGGKDVENRSRSTSYRGPLAIHAGTATSQRGNHDARVRTAWATYRYHHGYPDLVRGAILAVADLADCHPDTGCCRPWGESEYREAGGRTRTTIYHLRLDDVRALDEPIPYVGRLGLWTPDDDTVEHLTDWYTSRG